MIRREKAGFCAELGRGPGVNGEPMKRRYSSSPHSGRPKVSALSAFAAGAGLWGAAQSAQAQPAFTPIEVLAVEQLQDGALRVSTPEGWATLNPEQWAQIGRAHV